MLKKLGVEKAAKLLDCLNDYCGIVPFKVKCETCPPTASGRTVLAHGRGKQYTKVGKVGKSWGHISTFNN